MTLLNRVPAAAVSAFAILVVANSVEAHFIWLVPQTESGRTRVQVYFGEDASPDDPDLLDRLDRLVVYQHEPDAPPRALQLVRARDTLSANAVEATAADSLFTAKYDYGVLDRGDAVFRLLYHAKSGPAVGHPAWTEIDCNEHLPLDVVPTINGDTIHVRVRFQGEPVRGAEVKAGGPGSDDFTGVTDSSGRVSFPIAEAGLYSIRARHIENVAGELNGKHYNEVRHYSTVAVDVQPRPSTTASLQLPAIPQPVTSFGAAIADGALYIYGGHTGSAHSYSTAEQGSELRRVSLHGCEWETVAEGPPLQGLGLVSHHGKLYRIGGFTAKNAEGEEHDLWSQNSVARFDPATNEWADLPPLPEPRSSHDAAVVGDTIYVVGGWALAGDAEAVWHETAWMMELSQDDLEWKPLPTAPFRRRALAAAAHDGKLYVIGGMQQEGGPTTRVDIFDPGMGDWSQGPALRGEGMTGFGVSAFATGGRLYASASDGSLQRMHTDGSVWEVISRTPTARFFHRLLPVDDHRLLVVGGANMQVGKYADIEVLNVD